MEVSKLHIPAGHPNRPGTKLEKTLAIVFHYTANDSPRATDTMNAKYFGRPFFRRVSDGAFFEDGGNGKPLVDKKGQPVAFRYGSTQIIIDENSVTEAIPADEAAWSCGDRQLPYENGYKGQQPIAKTIFGGRQNYRTVSVEICNNASWEKAANNAAAWAISYILNHGLKVNIEKSLNPQFVTNLDVGEILLLRHHDITGKICPAPFVSNHAEWEAFVRHIAGVVGSV